MQKELEFLLKKYSVGKEAVLNGTTAVIVNGKAYPLLPWRGERRFIELRNLIREGAIHGISVMRTLRIVKKGSDLYKELYRELDLAQYILGTEITEIFAVGDLAYALNIIAKCREGCLCTFELSATLGENAPVIDKHEIIAKSGVACDRAADTLIPQNSIYVYGEKEAVYTDVDAELFGLSIEACAVVRSAFAIVKSAEDLSGQAAALEKLIDCTKRSLQCVENVLV